MRTIDTEQQKLFELLPAMVAYVDREQRYRFVNSSYCQWYNTTPDEIIGKTVREFFGDAEYDTRRDIIETALRGEALSYAALATSPGHKVRNAMIQLRPDKTESGETVGFLAVVTDQSEQMLQEQRLTESDLRFRQLAENLRHQVLYILDREPMQMSFISTSYEEIWGQSVAIIYEDPCSYLSAILESDRPKVMQSLSDQAKGLPTDTTYQIRRPDGSLRWIHDRATAVFNQNGKVIRTTGVAEDVTDRMQASMAKHELSLTLESISEGFFALDKNFIVVNANMMTEKIIGKSRDKILGQSCDEMFPLEDQKKFKEHYLRVMETGVAERFEETYGNRAVQVNAYKTVQGGVSIFFRDISDLRKATRLLRSSEDRLQLALQAGKLGTYSYDFATGEMEWSLEVYTIFGMDPKVNRPSFETLIRALHTEDVGSLEKFVKNPTEEIDLEYRILLPTGDVRWILTNGRFYSDAFGTPQYLIGTVQDITERKRSEQVLKESEHRFRTLVDAMPNMAFTCDSSGSTTYYNTRWIEFFEGCVGRVSIKARDWLDSEFYHPDDYGLAQKAWQESLRSDGGYQVELRLRDSKGNYRWHLGLANPVKDDVGNVVQWLGTFTDIDDQKTTEQALRASEERLQLAIESGQMGTWQIDLTNGLVSCSAETSALHGVKYLAGDLEVVIGQVVHPEDRETLAFKLNFAILNHAAYSHEYRIVLGDGEVRWLLASGKASYCESGKPDHFSGIVMDITTRRLISDALKTAKEEAETANRLKSAFLANMSHEIRTPLGVILGFGDLILDPQTSPKEREQYLLTLKKNSEQLMLLINDILDLSKVEAGYIQIEKIEFSVVEAIEDVVSSLFVKASEKGIRINFFVDSQVNPQIVSDPLRLKQILWNLFSNALKFTEVGEVTARLYQAEEKLVIDVQDTGIGIARDAKMKIFEPFTQADESMTRKYGGTGLGLALSKRLAVLLGGDLFLAKSDLGRGSTFTLRLKAVAPMSRFTQRPSKDTMPKAPDLNSYNLHALKVLLVEDSLDNQKLISRVLEKRGAQVTCAGNGVEGVRRALDEAHDIILMDVQMPLMDGFTATQRLREKGFAKPIIALTAHAMGEVRKRCMDAGCTDHLTKPINFNDLLRKMVKYTTLH